MEVLGFVHPQAGKQFVKGTIEIGESPIAAARRELREESGLVAPSRLESIGVHLMADSRQRWHFFGCSMENLPDTWQHETEDDLGHTFAFFWHPLDKKPDDTWHPVFHEAFEFFAPRLIGK